MEQESIQKRLLAHVNIIFWIFAKQIDQLAQFAQTDFGQMAQLQNIQLKFNYKNDRFNSYTKYSIN